MRKFQLGLINRRYRLESPHFLRGQAVKDEMSRDRSHFFIGYGDCGWLGAVGECQKIL